MIRPRILQLGTERDGGMAVSKPAAKPVPPPKRPAKSTFTMRHLWRMTVWGGAAAGALFVAVLASRSDVGGERAAGLFSGRGDRTKVAAEPFVTQSEERRLTEAVRGLAAENDALKSRLAAVEQNMDDITGSVARQLEAIKKTDASRAAPDRSPPAVAAPALPTVIDAPPVASAPRAAPAAAPASDAEVTIPPAAVAPIPAQGTAAAPVSNAPIAALPAVLAPLPSPALASAHAQMAAAEPVPPRIAMPVPAAAPPRAASPAATLKYGVDIGNAVSIEVLRARWLGIRSAHSKLFEGLIPVVMLRGVPHTGRIELRLVVGPLVSAEAAAKLCVALAPYRLACQPTLFSGQHIALQ
jgi:hypothetical protein